MLILYGNRFQMTWWPEWCIFTRKLVRAHKGHKPRYCSDGLMDSCNSWYASMCSSTLDFLNECMTMQLCRNVCCSYFNNFRNEHPERKKMHEKIVKSIMTPLGIHQWPDRDSCALSGVMGFIPSLVTNVNWFSPFLSSIPSLLSDSFTTPTWYLKKNKRKKHDCAALLGTSEPLAVFKSHYQYYDNY